MQPPSPLATPATIVAVPASELRIRHVTAHAANYKRQVRPITQAIVIHATDGHEGPRKAEDVAAMFARKPEPKRERSCTFVVDTDSIVQCVPPDLRAYHCGSTGNVRCEGVELCGFARQTREEWLDALSLPMLCLAARLVAERCRARDLPVEFVDRVGLRAGRRGITTHLEVSHAWQESRHTDPGPHFPLAEFIAAVKAAL